jgi:hypothetical protein
VEKRADSDGNEKGEALKQRLRGVRKRKQAQQRLGQEASAFKARLVEARRRVGH